MRQQDGYSRAAGVRESLVAAVIAASIVETLFEDVAVLAGWDIRARVALLFAGASLDLLLTLDLIWRLYGALHDGRPGRYLLAGRGWADLAASVPLVVFSSGPAVLAYFAAGSPAAGVVAAATLLRLARAVQAVRLLRLLRMVRLATFCGPAPHGSTALPAASRAATIAVAVVAVVGLAAAAVGPAVPGGDPLAAAAATETTIAGSLAAAPDPGPAMAAADLLRPEVLVVRKAGAIVYARGDLAAQLLPADTSLRTLGDVEVLFDRREALRRSELGSARLGLLLLAIVAAVAAAALAASGRSDGAFAGAWRGRGPGRRGRGL